MRDPRTGAIYPAGTPIPMTAFAQSAVAAARSDGPGIANNYRSCSSSPTTSTRRTASSTGRVNDRAVGLRPIRLARPVHRRPAADSAAVRWQQQREHLRQNKQLAVGTHLHAGRHVLFELRFGWSHTRGGQESAGARHAGRARGLTACRACRPIRASPAACRRRSSPAIPRLGRQSTNPQWQYPTVFNPKVNYTPLLGRQSIKAGYEFQHINTEVQDVNPLYGRDAYARSFTRPATAGANNLYNLSDFMLGLRSQYALSNVLVANLRQNMHFLYLQDDYRVNDKLTLNLGLRYEYATPQWERDNVLTNFDPATPHDDSGKGRLGRRSLAHRSGSQQLRSAARLCLHDDAETVIRGGWGVSYVHFNRAGGGNLLPINGPQVINAVVSQLDRYGALVPTDRTGLSGRA